MELDLNLTYSNTKNQKIIDSINYSNLDEYKKEDLEVILQLSVIYKRKKEIEILLDYGIDPDCKNGKRLETVPTLQIVSVKNEYGNYIHLYSCEYYGDDYETMELFLKNGASLIEMSKLFRIALDNQKFEICKVIIKYAKDIEDISEKQDIIINTSLYKILKSRNIELLRSFLKKFDPNLVKFRRYHGPILDFLCNDKWYEMMKLFVKYEFDLHEVLSFSKEYTDYGRLKLLKKADKIIKDVRNECRVLNLLLLSHYKDEGSFFHHSFFPLDLLKIILPMTGITYPKSKCVINNNKKRKVEIL